MESSLFRSPDHGNSPAVSHETESFSARGAGFVNIDFGWGLDCDVNSCTVANARLVVKFRAIGVFVGEINAGGRR